MGLRLLRRTIVYRNKSKSKTNGLKLVHKLHSTKVRQLSRRNEEIFLFCSSLTRGAIFIIGCPCRYPSDFRTLFASMLPRSNPAASYNITLIHRSRRVIHCIVFCTFGCVSQIHLLSLASRAQTHPEFEMHDG